MRLTEAAHCLYCGSELPSCAPHRGRKATFCSGSRCRVGHYRRVKRYTAMLSSVTKKPDLHGTLVLELFPGAGLFGKAFSNLGATVVAGPDKIWGGDVRSFHGIKGKFDIVIGGPPCQFASSAARSGTKAENLIPEFVRIVEECQPMWAVMENVREALPYAPEWDYVFLRDWDCGGLTHRRRGFWFYGCDAPPSPETRPGNPEYSVLASNWNARGEGSLNGGHLYLSPQDAARLQGFPGLEQQIMDGQPGWLRKDGTWKGVSKISREVLATHMMGNGVPFALGNYIAEYMARVRYSVTHHRIRTV